MLASPDFVCFGLDWLQYRKNLGSIDLRYAKPCDWLTILRQCHAPLLAVLLVTPLTFHGREKAINTIRKNWFRQFLLLSDWINAIQDLFSRLDCTLSSSCKRDSWKATQYPLPTLAIHLPAIDPGLAATIGNIELQSGSIGISTLRGQLLYFRSRELIEGAHFSPLFSHPEWLPSRIIGTIWSIGQSYLSNKNSLLLPTWI